ncbi:PilW family protein [Massilia sp. Bi118]|uniref:PilW family protein n=1 Tax=Massilia sp. Bi118 TaxID=2822346 RepID=UPI001E575C29|nr:PilW family protein [Massilia sp. Bi118]
MRSREQGFSLVELMISIVIGMLALVFALRLMSGSERTQRNGVGSSDAMQNGMLALFSMSGDAAQAGYGLNDPIIAGCDTVFSDAQHYALASVTAGGVAVTPLAPVIIEKEVGGASATPTTDGENPDRVNFYAGSSITGTGTLRLLSAYSAGTRIVVDRVPYGFRQGDVIVVAPEQLGGKCALAQISSDPDALAALPAQQSVDVVQNSDYRYNSGGLGASFGAGVSRVFNLGPASSLSFHTWSVANGFLQLRSTDMAGAAQNPAAVAGDIVSIKAQYGFDNRVGANFTPDAGMQVKVWSATMINADGDGVTGGAGDYLRIAAVRLAVVARSRTPDAAPAGGSCTATTGPLTVFAGGSAGADAVPVKVKLGVPDDTVDWRCYRYRVFETIVPLRNFVWRP